MAMDVTLGTVLFILTMMALSLGLFALHIYGAILGFRKKWYIGFLALFFGGFGIFLAIGKVFFKKDLLK